MAVGSPKYAAELTSFSNELKTQIITIKQSGKTVVVLLENDQALALIGIRDESREDARQAIAELNSLGIKSIMLSGDNAPTGKAIADTLGLEVRADLMPEDKLKLIAEFKTQGSITMIGDGINDAPALAASDVGIAMGGGDVALETAYAALLLNSVTGVVDLVKL